LEQVLENLTSNAIKYSPINTRITLRARKADSDLIIEVQDEGMGVSAEEQKQIFNPYHRVQQDTQKYPGIGLGLAVSRQIVEAHGGKIWVESQLGQGSIFIVKLPLNQAPE
jgi:signal transduction histidine kinase